MRASSYGFLKKAMKNHLLIICLVLTALDASAQGYLTGGFETGTNYYVKDLKTSAVIPDGNFGSNNYLKLDYHDGRFSAGVQMEAYSPALVGYSSELKGMDLTNYFVSWKDESFSVTAGTFYEQFGSGLLFRSWEDRAIGLNNATAGARITYSYKDILNVKAIWGMPRFGMSFSETQIKGADLSFAVSNLIGLNDAYIALEGSLLDRHEALDADMAADGCSSNTTGWSARLNSEYKGFYMRGEYVDAGWKHYYNTSYAGEGQMYHRKRGNAQLVEAGYNGNGLGVSLSLRRLEWMDSKTVRDASSSVNMLNYVPALCTQYTYMLTTLHPYGARTGEISSRFTNSGEIGGQIDVFYNVKRGTWLGGRKGMKVHANFSTYHTIAEEGTFKAGNLLFRDISVDVEKWWNRQFKSTLLWSYQEFTPSYGASRTTWLSNIMVADLLYKFNSSLAARMELQYLVTYEDQKDWMAALLEVSFAPHWSVYAADMYNHGMTKVHYYNGGVSYSKGRAKMTLGYGRYKAGYICSGGVCRQIPAYTGASLSFVMTL